MNTSVYFNGNLILKIKADTDYYQKCVNLNSVALCFQAFIMDEHDIMIPITDPVYSHPINNLSKQDVTIYM